MPTNHSPPSALLPVVPAPLAAPLAGHSEAEASVAPFRFRSMPATPRSLPSRELRPLADISRECRASWRRRARRLWCD